MTIVLGGAGSGTRTLAWVRERISRKAEGKGLYYAGTVTTGTTTTLTDPYLIDGEGDRWKGGEITVLSGNNAGLSRFISASAVGSLTFGAFPYALVAADTYELRHTHERADVDASITEAILAASGIILLPTAGTATWVSGVDTYALPEEMTHLSEVLYTDSQGVKHPLRFNHWACPMDGTVVLDADALGNFSASQPTITLRGYRKPTLPTNDGDPVEVDAAFVIFYALGILRGEGFASAQVDADDDARAFTTFVGASGSRLSILRTPLRPNTRRVR